MYRSWKREGRDNVVTCFILCMFGKTCSGIDADAPWEATWSTLDSSATLLTVPCELNLEYLSCCPLICTAFAYWCFPPT